MEPARILVVSISLAFAFVSSGCGGNQSAPRTIIRPLTQRVVAQGNAQNVEAVCTVVNNGRGELSLGTAVVDCSCSVASINPRKVPSGGTAKITIKGRILPLQEKKVAVIVTTSDAEFPKLEFGITLVGSTSAPIVLEAPKAINLGILSRSDNQVHESLVIRTLETKEEGQFFQRIVPSTNLISIKLIDVVKLAQSAKGFIKEYKYEVTLDSQIGTRKGGFLEELVFYAKDQTEEGHEVARITVGGFVRESVYAIPSQMRLQSDELGMFTVTVSLACDDMDFVLDTLCTSDWICATLVSSLSNRKVYTLSGNVHSLLSKSSVFFSTNHPLIPFIEIPFQVD